LVEPFDGDKTLVPNPPVFSQVYMYIGIGSIPTIVHKPFKQTIKVGLFGSSVQLRKAANQIHQILTNLKQ
jgi:hypothetical protein